MDTRSSMLSTTGIVVLLIVLTLSLISPNVVFSQAEPPAPASPEEANATTALITPLISYQGRLVEDGIPVNGTRSMSFLLYNASSGGTLVWQEGPKTISVSGGLFSTALGSSTPFDTTMINNMDQNLWLEIHVSGVTLPRQRLMGAPYAFSLVPGADVDGDLPAGQSALYVQNRGDGWGVLGSSAGGYGLYGDSATSHGLYARGASGGLVGAALLAESSSSNGIGVWALTNSVDTTLVASNDGAGPLFKGFGGDSGEHEIIILNDGTVQQDLGASGLVKAGAYVVCSNTSTSITRSFNNVGGTIAASNGTVAGNCLIDFGFQINSRYFVAQGIGSVPRSVSCYFPTSTSLNCLRFDDDGIGISGEIMILIY